MNRYLPAIFPLLALAVLATACNGGGSPTATPRTSAGATPTAQPTEASDERPSPTAATGQTPAVEDTPAIMEGTPSAIDQTAVAAGTPAPSQTPVVAVTPTAVPTPVTANVTREEAQCVFDTGTSTADCAEWGSYTIDPPLLGGYTACVLAIFQEQPTLLVCSGNEHVPTVYYPIP